MRFRHFFPRRLNARTAALPVAAILVLATFACSLDKLTSPSGKGTNSISASVTGDTTVSLGGTTTMSVRTATGAISGGDVVMRWSSSNPTVASVDEKTGVVTGLKLGSVTISATIVAPELGEVRATARSVRVKYASIKISAVDSLIAIGMTREFDVLGTNASGAVSAVIPFAEMEAVTRDSAIFVVSQSGELVATGNGTARLFVQYDGLKDSVNVKVRQLARSISFPTAVAGELAIQSIAKDRPLQLAPKDSLGVEMTAYTGAWSSSDPSTVLVNATTGVARGLKLGTARIRVTVDGIKDSIVARVTQVTAKLNKTAGDNTSATAGANVSTVPRVVVADSGDTPIPGIVVTFAVVTGGGSLSGATQTSSATGGASPTSWTLGTTAGPNTMTATAGEVSTTFTATGTPGLPVKLIYATQPAAAAANTPIPTVSVAVADVNGNVVTTATNSITIAVASGPGAIGGTVTAAAVAGVASFSNLQLGTLGTYTLSASASGLTSVVSSSFQIYGPPVNLAFGVQPTDGTAGQPLPEFSVLVTDANGATNTTATNSISLSTTPAAALGGTTTVAAINGVATFDNVIAPAAGTYTINATATGLAGATSNSITIAAVGPPTKLAFLATMNNIVAGTTIASIQVAVQDANGAPATSSSANVTLGIENNPGSSTLSATSLTVAAINGIATFENVSLNRSGNGYTLKATSAGLTNGVSGAFDVLAGPAAKLAFSGAIPNAVVSQAISPAVQVQVQDAYGNLIASSTASVSLAATGGGGGTLTGGGPIAAMGGVATFSAASIGTIGANYQLTASSSGLASATSTAFNVVSAAAPIKLGFIAQPTNVASGDNMSVVQVAIQDAAGNTVSTTNTQITLTLTNNTTGAVMNGQTSRFTANGIVSFTDLQFTKVGTGYTLTASATNYTTAVSTSFDVSPGAAAQTAFIVQPPATQTAGVPFETDLVVEVQDIYGNLVPTATNQVGLFLNQNFGSLRPSNPTATAVNGIATFSGIRVTTAGTGYTLTSYIENVGGGVSSTFEITPAPAAALSFATTPSDFVAGQILSPNYQVQVTDSVGNLISSATNSITLGIHTAPAGAAISGTTVQSAVAGVATFPDLSLNKQGCWELMASADGLTSSFHQFCVNPGPAAQLMFSNQPTNTFVNAPLNPGTNSVQILVTDSQGNQVSSNASITLSLGSNPSSASLAGTVTGNASFGSYFVPNDVKIDKVGAGVTLVASSPGLASATSVGFNVAAFSTPAELIWKTQPTDKAAGALFSPAIQMAVADAYGNIVTDNNGTEITIGCQEGCSQVQQTATTSAGIATFTNYSITSAGTFTLFGFSNSPSLGADQSNSFTVTAMPVTPEPAALFPDLGSMTASHAAPDRSSPRVAAWGSRTLTALRRNGGS